MHLAGQGRAPRRAAPISDLSETITDKLLGAVEEVREGRADSKGRTAVRISITSSLTASSGVRVQLASGSFFAVCRFGLGLNRFWR